jgi:hypothetical protein
MSEGSISFAKGIKKLLPIGGSGNNGASAPSEARFLCFILFTKRSSYLLSQRLNF